MSFNYILGLVKTALFNANKAEANTVKNAESVANVKTDAECLNDILFDQELRIMALEEKEVSDEL